MPEIQYTATAPLPGLLAEPPYHSISLLPLLTTIVLHSVSMGVFRSTGNVTLIESTLSIWPPVKTTIGFEEKMLKRSRWNQIQLAQYLWKIYDVGVIPASVVASFARNHLPRWARRWLSWAATPVSRSFSKNDEQEWRHVNWQMVRHWLPVSHKRP